MSTRIVFGFLCGLLGTMVACGKNATPTAPSAPTTTPATPTPTPQPPALTTFHLTGMATDDGGAPVPGASILVYPWKGTGQAQAPLSVVTDGSGFYRIDIDATRYIPGPLAWIATGRIEKSGYETTHGYAYPTTVDGSIASLPFHLYRVKRIAAGDSINLVVIPGDGNCGSEDEFICRTVRVTAPVDGTITLDAVPTLLTVQSLSLEVYVVFGVYRCCSTPTSFHVTAGTEVVANIGINWQSTASQAFTFNTSLRPD
jgi:hypothetical protein